MSFKDLFDEYFYVGCLPEREQKKYLLISRYEDKVSKRLLIEKEELYKEAKAWFGETVRELMGQPNTFLELIKKDEQSGVLYHQPVILGIEHGVTFKGNK